MLYIGIVHRVCYPGYDSFSGFFSRDLYSFPFFCPRDTRRHTCRHTAGAASRPRRTYIYTVFLYYATVCTARVRTRDTTEERRETDTTRHRGVESRKRHTHARRHSHTTLDGTTAHGLAQHSDTAPKVPIPQQFHRLQTPIMALLTGP